MLMEKFGADSLSAGSDIVADLKLHQDYKVGMSACYINYIDKAFDYWLTPTRPGACGMLRGH